MTSTGAEATIAELHPDDPRARTILRAYLEDVAGSYHGRRLTEAEVDAAVAEFPDDDLAPPRGLLLVACSDAVAVGCVGLRLLGTEFGEVTRLYVAPGHRRTGLGDRLMAELERRAGARGLGRLRLDTRADLTAARRLYARRGFRDAEPFPGSPYSDVWLEKPISPGRTTDPDSRTGGLSRRAAG